MCYNFFMKNFLNDLKLKYNKIYLQIIFIILSFSSSDKPHSFLDVGKKITLSSLKEIKTGDPFESTLIKLQLGNKENVHQKDFIIYIEYSDISPIKNLTEDSEEEEEEEIYYKKNKGKVQYLILQHHIIDIKSKNRSNPTTAILVFKDGLLAEITFVEDKIGGLLKHSYKQKLSYK
jgi:hypothetical protein